MSHFVNMGETTPALCVLVGTLQSNASMCTGCTGCTGCPGMCDTVGHVATQHNRFVKVLEDQGVQVMNCVATCCCIVNTVIATPRGIVIGRQKQQQQQQQHDLSERTKCWFMDKLNQQPIGYVKEPGILTSTDIITCDASLTIVSIGSTTNIDGVKQCMVNNWFGTDKVCIVHCPNEIPLRCYFGMVNSKTVLLWKGAMDFKVDEWSDSIKTHEFIRIRTAVSLYAYLTVLGYKVLLISDESYANMGCSVMYINDTTVLTQDDDVTMLISKKCRDVKAICIEYNGSSGGGCGGGFVCTSAVVWRQ